MKPSKKNLNWLDLLSFAILATFCITSVLIGLFGNSLSLVVDVSQSLQAPSMDFLFGTDLLGKSIFLKALFGIKSAIFYGLLASLIATSIGTSLGALSGFFGGALDNLSLAVASVLDSVPYILLVSATSLAFGQGLFSLGVIIGLTGWMKTFRLVRGETTALREAGFVTASQALGNSDLSIVKLHILPNILHFAKARFGISFIHAVKLEIVLTFLGIGAEAGTVTWGTLVNDAQGEISEGIWTSLVLVTVLLLFLSAAVQSLANK